MIRRLLSFLAIRALTLSPLASEIIYDNTSTFLGTFAPERTEYGDQLDLAGTARTLTELYFDYYAHFVPDGSQIMRVRLYSNEDVYDDFRKKPTKILYESGFMPVPLSDNGYNTTAITNLNVQLPRDTVTFTIEFRGFKTNEQAGLLLYSPPTVGFSFNEFWDRYENGDWVPIRYSLTDLSMKANAGIRLVAVPGPVLDQRQTNSDLSISLRESRSRIRVAQTFVPQTGGRLDRVMTTMSWKGAPSRLRILDTASDGTPGTNAFGTAVLSESSATPQPASFYDQGVYLIAGQQYAIEYSTDEPFTSAPNYTLRCGDDPYSGGKLWYRDEEPGGAWKNASLLKGRGSDLNVVFETWVVPGGPPVRITHPESTDKLLEGEGMRIQTVADLPDGKVPAKMTFFADDQQIGQITAPPFEFVWTGASAGLHTLRAFAEDSLREVYRSDPTEIMVKPTSRPVNDDFEDRIPVQGPSVRVAGSSAGGTLEFYEQRLSTNMAGASLWWVWTAASDAPATVTAQHSDGDAEVAVYSGESLPTLEFIAGGLQSCTFTPMVGRRYAVVVDPRTRGDQILLEIVSADVGITSAVPDRPVLAPFTLEMQANDSLLRDIANVKFLANGALLGETSSPPFKCTQTFTNAGAFDLTVAATDAQGITTYSSARRLTVLPPGGQFAFNPAGHLLDDGSFSIAFDSLQNLPVKIDYSDDLKTWKSVQGVHPGSGQRDTFVDDGPPKTDKNPKQTSRRFYRFSSGL